MEQIKAYYGQNKNMVLGLAGVIILIIIIVAAHAFFASSSTDTGSQMQVQSQSSPPAPVSSGYKSSVAKPVQDTPRISYADALAKYKNYTIQFDNKCNTLTFKRVYKNNTDIMIDNRGSTKIFSVGASQISIPTDDFAIVTLSSATLPKTVDIDCGNMQNVSEITLEK